MNGKASKRIRIAARIISRPYRYQETVKRLKREYRALPYHQRATSEVVSHSTVLRRYHGRVKPFTTLEVSA